MLGLGTAARKVFGTPNDRKVKSTRPTVQKINALEPEFEALSDADLKARTLALKERVAAGESLDDILPEAFANCREAGRRLPRPRAPWRRPAGELEVAPSQPDGPPAPVSHAACRPGHFTECPRSVNPPP